MNKSILNWLCEWYIENCNGDWEHQNGVKIESIDNPGWSIIIDLQGTSTNEINSVPWQLFKKEKNGWYGYKIEGGKFEGSCDPLNLEQLILIFKESIEMKSW